MNRRGAYQKRDRNIDNVQARYQLLVAGIADPDNVNETVRKGLSDQRRFAALSIKGTSIRAVALNTLKSIADDMLAPESPDGKGFLYLDALRCQLKAKTHARLSSRTVGAQKHRRDEAVNELKEALRQTELLNLQRSHAYVDLFSKLVSLVKAASLDDATRLRLHNLLQDHKDLYAPLLAPGTETAERVLRVIAGGKE